MITWQKDCQPGQHRLRPLPGIRNYFECRHCKTIWNKAAIEKTKKVLPKGGD